MQGLIYEITGSGDRELSAGESTILEGYAVCNRAFNLRIVSVSCAGESNDGSHCLLTRRVTSGRRASSSPASYPEIVKMWYVRTGA